MMTTVEVKLADFRRRMAKEGPGKVSFNIDLH